MFKEYELPTWSQHTTETANGVRYAGNRAEREGAHDGVNGVVLQRDSFSWKVQKFYIDLRSPPLGLGQPNHSGVWFQRVDLAYS